MTSQARADETPRWLRDDLVAGLTVAVVAIPQSMAYAILAGAPPAFGLYTSIVSGIVGSLFGSSRHLITGPTNATAVIFASTLAASGGEFEPIQGILLYTFLIWCVKCAFGILRLGRLVQFVSDSVIVGFTAGAGFLIAGNQLSYFLGLPPHNGSSFFLQLMETLRSISQIHWPTVILAVSTLVVIIGLQRIDRRIPSALFACVLGAVVVQLFGLTSLGVRTTADLGSISHGLPPIHIPTFEWPQVYQLLSGAIAVAVIGLMEATAISKSIATSSGQRLDPNREFVAQGLANIVGAFFSNYASSGSMTRSMLNYHSGAQTRWAGVISGLAVAVALVTIGPLGEKVPIACLAGLLMLIAWRMVNRERLRMALRAGRESTITLIATVLATLFLRLDIAIYVGVAVSLAFFIKQSSEARLTLLVREDDDTFREVPCEQVSEKEIAGQVVVLNIIGAMYFGAMDEHERQIRRIVHAAPKALVLRLRRVSNIDSSGLTALGRFHTLLQIHAIPVTLCGIDDSLFHTLKRAGLIDQIGEFNVFRSHDLVFHSVKVSVDRAIKLSGIDSPRPF